MSHKMTGVLSYLLGVQLAWLYCHKGGAVLKVYASSCETLLSAFSPCAVLTLCSAACYSVDCPVINQTQHCKFILFIWPHDCAWPIIKRLAVFACSYISEEPLKLVFIVHVCIFYTADLRLFTSAYMMLFDLTHIQTPSASSWRGPHATEWSEHFQ